MHLEQRLPRPHLAQFVEHYWYVHTDAVETELRPDKILPNDTINLMFNLSGCVHRQYDPQDLSRWAVLKERWISGMRDEYICIGPTVCTRVVGIRFKPGGVAPLLPMPVSELSRQIIDLDDVWGHATRRLHERLADASSVTDCFDLLESWLTAQVRIGRASDARVRFCLHQMQATNGRVTIAMVAEHIGVSQKQLRRLFERDVGLAPKRMAQIIRFQAAVERVDAIQGEIDWSLLAGQCGYYDQSHLIADFDRFSGVTPSRYLELERPAPGFLAVEAPMSLFSKTRTPGRARMPVSIGSR